MINQQNAFLMGRLFLTMYSTSIKTTHWSAHQLTQDGMKYFSMFLTLLVKTLLTVSSTVIYSKLVLRVILRREYLDLLI
jgi:hypothetical protein